MRELRAALLSLLALAAVTLVYALWIDVTNATIVALTFLFIVLITAATSRLRVAVVTSVAAMLSFNFFFLPPVGTWRIADPQNWVALFVFLAVSLVASRLSHVARAQPWKKGNSRTRFRRRRSLPPVDTNREHGAGPPSQMAFPSDVAHFRRK